MSNRERICDRCGKTIGEDVLHPGNEAPHVCAPMPSRVALLAEAIRAAWAERAGQLDELAAEAVEARFVEAEAQARTDERERITDKLEAMRVEYMVAANDPQAPTTAISLAVARADTVDSMLEAIRGA